MLEAETVRQSVNEAPGVGPREVSRGNEYVIQHFECDPTEPKEILNTVDPFVEKSPCVWHRPYNDQTFVQGAAQCPMPLMGSIADEWPPPIKIGRKNNVFAVSSSQRSTQAHQVIPTLMSVSGLLKWATLLPNFRVYNQGKQVVTGSSGRGKCAPGFV